MLKNIKSYYFIKILFNYTDEKQKLKIVKKNKSLQKNIDINIINYKYFSGRYIIYESKRIGKEYFGDYDDLIFEGEYLNGERNGKGKEYYENGNKLLFEGEYKNGKKNRYGKIYLEGKLFFEGEFLDGKMNGKGKMNDFINSKSSFEGEYLNDKEWIGTKYDKNGNIIYKINNNKNGTGIGLELYDNCLKKYEGEYLNGKRN